MAALPRRLNAIGVNRKCRIVAGAPWLARQSVQGLAITILNRNSQDYLSLTDIARYLNPEEPFAIINNWMRSRSTIEFLGLWEKLCNPEPTFRQRRESQMHDSPPPSIFLDF